jgi:hypothetical protein
MQYITKQFNKAVPYIERFIKWVVRTVFELLKLTGLAFMVMHLIVAAFAIEVAITSIVVFSAVYLTKRSR